MATKYNPEFVQRLADEIALSGNVVLACSATGIDPKTYRRWLEKYPDFAQKMDSALKKFDSIRPRHQQVLARESITSALDGRRKITKTVRKHSVIERRDASGTLLFTDVIEKTEITQQELPAPPWAISAVLPKPTFTLDQLGAIASEYGMKLIIENAEVFKKYLESLEVPKLIEEASQHPDDIL